MVILKLCVQNGGGLWFILSKQPEVNVVHIMNIAVVYIMNTAGVVYNMNTARSKCGWVLFNIWCAMCWDE